MNCEICTRAAKDREAFWSISWEKVDKFQFDARKKDGRSTKITQVCPECIKKYNDGRPPLGLKDLNEIRERGITKEQYYNEHGY